MQTKVKMPRVGENVSQVFVVELTAPTGQEIMVGDILISVETDKATLDIPSPVSGHLVEYLVTIDQEVSVGEPFVIIDTK